VDEPADGVLDGRRDEGVPHRGGCNLKFTLTPVDYCCPYYEITANIQKKYCVNCGFSWFKPKGEKHES